MNNYFVYELKSEWFHPQPPLSSFPTIECLHVSHVLNSSYKIRISKQYEEYAIFQYVLKGKGRFFVNGDKFDLHSGEGFIVNTSHKDFYYDYPEGESEVMEVLWIRFGGSVSSKMIEELYNQYGHKIKLPLDYGLIPQLIERLSARTIHTNQSQSENTFLAMKIIHNIHNSLEKNLGEKPPPVIQEVLKLIYNNETTFFQVQDLAQHCDVSREYLSRLFKAHMKESLYDYIINLKLQLVVQKLTFGKDSLQDIADQLGFSSKAHLHALFKNRFKISPLKYRRKSS
ncbi:MAG: AraC family transcriptional regulator [Lentisphaeria bacterium]|nr:AraC family transcriptional regulator [Lentisphaeria bacterium]